MQAPATFDNIVNFNPNNPPERTLTRNPKPPSQHCVAFAIKRSPILALLEQAIWELPIGKDAKVTALADAERMFAEFIALGPRGRANLHPVARLLDAFGCREFYAAKNDTQLGGTSRFQQAPTAPTTKPTTRRRTAMSTNQPHVLVALVGEQIEIDDETIEVGTILMAEYPTEAEADAERERRNALVRHGHPAHAGRQYITMTAEEFASMSGKRGVMAMIEDLIQRITSDIQTIARRYGVSATA